MLKTENPEKARHQDAHHDGRHVRTLLLVLFLLTALFTGGVLYLKYQLEELRESVQTEARSRLGIEFDAGEVKVFDLRGLRITDFQAFFRGTMGQQINVSVAEAFVYIDIMDLLYGKVTVEQFLVDGAIIEVAAAPEEQQAHTTQSDGTGLSSDVSFRILGRDCQLRIENFGEGAPILIAPLSLDISRLAGSPDLTARLSGNLDGVQSKRIDMNVRYTSVDDFDLRIQADNLLETDLHHFVPAAKPYLVTGQTSPSIRVSGYPGNAVIVSLEIPFRRLTVRGNGELPVPSDGTLTALARYDLKRELLSITTAQVSSASFEGRVKGEVSFSGDEPVLALDIELDEFPMAETIQVAMQELLSTYGDAELHFQEPYTIGLTISGPIGSPQWGVGAEGLSGTVSFRPRQPYLPIADFQFEHLTMAWDSERATPEGALTITDGTLVQVSYGLRTQDLSGTLLLKEGTLSIDPIHAELSGNRFTGSLSYDLDTQQAAFSLTGTLANVEDTLIGSALPKATLSGNLALTCSGRIAADRLEVDIVALDATQSQIDYDWWFRKPVGMGASINKLHFDMVPGKSIEISASGTVDASKITVAMDFAKVNDRWGLDWIRAESDSLDVVSLGKCLRVPYGLTGGTGRAGYFELRQSGDNIAGHIIKMGMQIDTISLLPHDGKVPIVCENAHVDVVADNSTESRTVTINIDAEAAKLPPFGTRWILPLRSDDAELNAKFPPLPKTISYSLSVATLAYPPWEGTSFIAAAYSNELTSGLSSFSAKVGEGTLQGAYEIEKGDNISELTASWIDIPAHYLLEHMNFPPLLTGTATGDIHYSLDQDDPGTLTGSGSFIIRDGQFSSDYLASQFEETLQGDVTAIPPSPKFRSLRSDVALAGDLVTTRNFKLDSDVLSIQGTGKYILDGDMDYELTLAIPAETARRIPVMSEYLNIEGLRLTQGDIQLGFKITGPSFSPNAAITELPNVGVSLMSGAVEVGMEVTKVVDIPRQIFLDVLKTIGGIIGVNRQVDNRQRL